jgi:succinoglycan biosynthesis protein ExoO
MSLVSIILATHNNENTIGKAVASAQGQTLQHIEIIIVDDGSTDSTYDHVSRLAAGDPRIKCVRLQQNLGPGGARNAALARATGEWISILDGDDWYEPNRLEVLLRAAYDHKADLEQFPIRMHHILRRQNSFGIRWV